MLQLLKNKIAINKIRVAFIAAFAFIAIFLLATYSNMNRAESESRNVKSALDVLLRLENILVDIQSIETGQRGFTISGDERFLDTYNEGLSRIRRDTSILAQLQLRDSTKSEERSRLLSLLNKKIEYSKFVVETRRIYGYDSAAVRLQSTPGKAMMDDIAAAISSIEFKDRVLLQQSNQERQKYAKRTVWQFFALAVLFCFILYYSFKTILKDFTLLEKNEKTLKFNASLIQNISDPIITTDAKNNITNWNFYAEKLYGYKEEEIVGKEIDSLLNITVSRPLLGDKKEDSIQNDYWKGEAIHHHKNGQAINVEVSTSSIKTLDGEVIGTVGVIRDITQRKNMEHQLQQFTYNLQQQVKVKVAELNNVFERIADAFIALDNQWNYTYVNKKAAELHDKDSEYLIGKNIWQEFPDVMDEPFYEALRTAKETQQPQRLQLYYSVKDRWYENLIYPSSDGMSVYYHDITTRKKAELSLKEVHEKLSYHIQNTPMGVIEFDNNMEILQWSKMAETIFGWTTEEVVDGKFDTYQLVYPDDKEMVRNSIRELGAAEMNNNVLHIRNQTKSGRIIYCEWYNSVLKDHRGNTIGIMSLVQDVTLRKRAEIDLQEAESKFRSLVEQSMVGVYIIQDEKLVYVNPRFAQIFGYSSPEMNELFNPEDIIHPDDHEKVLNHIRARIMGKYKSMNYEFKGLHKNGELLYLEAFGTITLYQGKPAIIGTLINVTERKKSMALLESSEHALQTSNERFLLVAKATNDAVWDWDMLTDKIWGNESFRKIFELEAGEDFSFNDFSNRIQADDRELILHNFKQALIKKETFITEEFRLNEKRGGKYRILYDRAYIIYNAEKRAYRMLGAMQDVTEEKESEKRLVSEKELSDSIINSLPGVFYLYSKSGQFYRWNKNFETVTGYTREEIDHLHPIQLFKEEEKELLASKIVNVFESGEDNVTADFVSKDGTLTPFYFTGMLINYEGETCLMGVGIDISESKKAAESLRLSENKYRLLFNQNPMPMWMISMPERNFLDVNPAAVAHYGYSREEFLQMNIRDIRPENNIVKLENSFGNYPVGINNTGIWQHIKKDGTVIQVNIITHDISYEDQEAKLVLANDITEKIIAEENLKRSHEELRELATYLENIRESERTHMAREIHDELGQQLTGLKMDISWLNKRIQSEDEEVNTKIKDTIKLIDKTVVTVRRIATQLRPSILDDLGLIAAMEWQSEEFQKRAEIRTGFKSNVANVDVKPEIATGVFRIYQESLTNVLRHSAASEVNSSLTIEQGRLELIIIDNGKGFNIDDIEHKKTLGLLGMKERSLLMGGEYEISGRPGIGTSVRITVPLN
jgi:PAS domain S-box-containing protein